jgi:hypothetical protein
MENREIEQHESKENIKLPQAWLVRSTQTEEINQLQRPNNLPFFDVMFQPKNRIEPIVYP